MMVVEKLVARSGQITPALLSSLPHSWRPILPGCTHRDSSEWVLLQVMSKSSVGFSPTPNVLLVIAVCKNSRLYIPDDILLLTDFIIQPYSDYHTR